MLSVRVTFGTPLPLSSRSVPCTQPTVASDEQLVAGEIHVKKGGENIFLAVGDGFVQVTGEKISILTDMAIRGENIDEAKAEEARQRAEARLAEKLTDEEAASASAALAHSLAQLKVKRRTRK